MASREKTVICFILISLLYDTYGLSLTMERKPGYDVCGHLQCWNDVVRDGNIFTVFEISVYDVTQADSRLELASVLVNATGQYLEQIKSNSIKGSGSISRYHANLTLDFRDETDCLFGSFQCELQFVNTSGQIDLISETVTPKELNNGSSCDAIIFQFMKLKTQSDKSEKELTEIRSNHTILKEELAEVKKELTELKYNATNVTEELTILRELKAKVEMYYPHAMQNIFMVPCFRGMPHNNTREKFQLWGTSALCDTETDSGGWVIIQIFPSTPTKVNCYLNQRRTKGDVDFYRNWTDYRTGFGTPDTDFWIGNENIHNLTSLGYNELRIDMEYKGTKYFAHYSNFSVSDELSGYKLSVSGYSGTAGDSLIQHSGSMFRTLDRNYDGSGYTNCAVTYHTGYWCYNSYYSNLNGRWGVDAVNGAFWWYVSGTNSLSFIEMKIRTA